LTIHDLLVFSLFLCKAEGKYYAETDISIFIRDHVRRRNNAGANNLAAAAGKPRELKTGFLKGNRKAQKRIDRDRYPENGSGAAAGSEKEQLFEELHFHGHRNCRPDGRIGRGARQKYQKMRPAQPGKL
jgi:hypothetical protein